MTNNLVFGRDTDEFFKRFELVEQIGVGGKRTLHLRVSLTNGSGNASAPAFLFLLVTERSYRVYVQTGFATVHQGIDRHTNELVAVKVCFTCLQDFEL
jgi:hypothetical protein